MPVFLWRSRVPRLGDLIRATADLLVGVDVVDDRLLNLRLVLVCHGAPRDPGRIGSPSSRHAVLSYMFGVLIIATTINFIAGLARALSRSGSPAGNPQPSRPA
jgi:hypothetical protein